MSRDPRNHLTDEEFLAFVLDELPTGLDEAVDQHLTWCVACTQQLEDVYAAQEAFPAAQWEAQRAAFVATLRQRIFDPPTGPGREVLERLRTFLALVAYQLAPAQYATAREPWDQESPDGQFGVFVEEVKGDVTVHVDAQETQLAGVTIRFTAGPWQHDVQFITMDDDQVGAKLVIPRTVWATLPKGAMLRANLVEDSQDTGPAVS